MNTLQFPCLNKIMVAAGHAVAWDGMGTKP